MNYINIDGVRAVNSEVCHIFPLCEKENERNNFLIVIIFIFYFCYNCSFFSVLLFISVFFNTFFTFDILPRKQNKNISFRKKKKKSVFWSF